MATSDPDTLLTEGAHLIAACEDCGLPYEQFPLDTVLPDADWLTIHPTGDGGLLCAGCIATRAATVPGNIVLYARLVSANEHEHFSTLKNEPLARLAQITEERDTWRDECRRAQGGECALIGKLQQAEADLARVTQERDTAREMARTSNVLLRSANAAEGIARTRAERAEADLARLHAEGATLIAEMRAETNARQSRAALMSCLINWVDRLESLCRRPPTTQEDPNG